MRPTRYPVWVLEQARRLGSTDTEMLENFPGLQTKDLVDAWEYVKAHSDEIDRQIVENEAREDQEDIEAAREALKRIDREGAVPWDQVKAELGL